FAVMQMRHDKDRRRTPRLLRCRRQRDSRASLAPGSHGDPLDRVRAQRIIAMSARICVLLAWGLLGTAIVSGCTGGPAAPHHVASHHVASGAPLPPQPVTRAAARHCPKTIPSRVGPPGTSPADLFGWASSYGNGKLWVGGLGSGGVIVARDGLINPDGSIGWKYGWGRKAAGHLSITGPPVGGPPPPAGGFVPDGHRKVEVPA